MAWTAVETPNAKYVLLFSHHWKTLERSPTKFDALVLEDTSEKKETPSNVNLRKEAQYKRLVEQAIDYSKPIWVVDAALSPASKKRSNRIERFEEGSIALGFLGVALTAFSSIKKGKVSRRDFLKAGISVGLLSPLLIRLSELPFKLSEEKIKHHAIWGTSSKIREIESGRGIIQVRNALAAEKCESFLAPLLWKQLGRKPVIAMAWGSAHYGVKDFLLHPQKRQKFLEETDLAKYLQKDYPASFRIHLDREGKIKRIEKFPETLKLLKRQKHVEKEKLNRRAFLKSLISRRMV